MTVVHSKLSFELFLALIAHSFTMQLNNRLWSDNSHVQFVVSGNKVLLNDHEVSYLLKVYRIPYLNTDVSTMQSLIGRFITQYKQLESNGLVGGHKHHCINDLLML